MNRLFFTILIFLVLLSCRKSTEYELVFGEAYQQAIEFIEENDSLISENLGTGLKKHEKVSIVFPELIKYTLYQDILETTALELIYVAYGKKYADFSVGYFQMKPSFIEGLESEVKKSEKLSKAYPDLVFYKDSIVKEIRKSRLARLKSIEWQLKYLNCFYDYIALKHPDSHWKNRKDKVKFYATAYNYNFMMDKSLIDKQINQKYFPFGKRKGNNQYSYSDIAAYYLKSQLGD